MPKSKIAIKPELLSEIKTLCENNREISVVSLCTTDGFTIKSFVAQDLNMEADKLAAMSSTLSALSDSCANMLMLDEFNVTIVESNAGNTLFVRTRYLELECVLTVTARIKMSLATARYHTKKLAQTISLFTE